AGSTRTARPSLPVPAALRTATMATTMPRPESATRLMTIQMSIFTNVPAAQSYSAAQSPKSYSPLRLLSNQRPLPVEPLHRNRHRCLQFLREQRDAQFFKHPSELL